jgi:Cytochrome bd terminal oxidase subunit II
MAISFWPYMIPFSITIEEAAAPHSSLAFMFWGASLFVFPLMLLYTIVSYTVFRGNANLIGKRQQMRVGHFIPYFMTLSSRKLGPRPSKLWSASAMRLYGA